MNDENVFMPTGGQDPSGTDLTGETNILDAEVEITENNAEPVDNSKPFETVTSKNEVTGTFSDSPATSDAASSSSEILVGSDGLWRTANGELANATDQKLDGKIYDIENGVSKEKSSWSINSLDALSKQNTEPDVSVYKETSKPKSNPENNVNQNNPEILGSSNNIYDRYQNINGQSEKIIDRDFYGENKNYGVIETASGKKYNFSIDKNTGKVTYSNYNLDEISRLKNNPDDSTGNHMSNAELENKYTFNEKTGLYEDKNGNIANENGYNIDGELYLSSEEIEDSESANSDVNLPESTESATSNSQETLESEKLGLPDIGNWENLLLNMENVKEEIETIIEQLNNFQYDGKNLEADGWTNYGQREFESKSKTIVSTLKKQIREYDKLTEDLKKQGKKIYDTDFEWRWE